MRIEWAEIEHYGVCLKDKSRPPSRVLALRDHQPLQASPSWCRT